MNGTHHALTLAAPAKINLWLRVLGRRESDGYHELDTRMVPLTLADAVGLKIGGPGTGLRFACDAPGVPRDGSNLAVRAVRALEEATQMKFDVEVSLEKHIPSGAGLGGGSSDAAAVLMGIDHLFELGIGRDRLVPIAASLGADVPFFLFGQPCDCRGVGEIIEPGQPMDRLPLLLVKPNFGVPTPWAYSRWRDAQEIPGIDYRGQETPWGTLRNDLERPVFEKFPILFLIKRWLREQEGVEAALLSGSGATVFAILTETADAAKLEGAAREAFGDPTWICATSIAGAHVTRH